MHSEDLSTFIQGIEHTQPWKLVNIVTRCLQYLNSKQKAFLKPEILFLQTVAALEAVKYWSDIFSHFSIIPLELNILFSLLYSKRKAIDSAWSSTANRALSLTMFEVNISRK